MLLIWSVVGEDEEFLFLNEAPLFDIELLALLLRGAAMVFLASPLERGGVLRL